MFLDAGSGFGGRAPDEQNARERFWTSLAVLALLTAMLTAFLFV